MCGIDNAEGSWAAYELHQRKARKVHECSECRRDIEPGEVYEDLHALWDGSWQTYKTCAHCKRAGEWLDIVCGGWLHLGLWEDLNDHLDEYPGMWLRLAVSGVGSGWGTRSGGSLWSPLGRIKWWKLGVPGLASKLSRANAMDRAVSYGEDVRSAFWRYRYDLDHRRAGGALAMRS